MGRSETLGHSMKLLRNRVNKESNSTLRDTLKLPESSRRLGVTGAPGSSPGRQHPSLRAPEVCLQRPSQGLLSPEIRLVGVAKEGTEITKMNEDGTEPPTVRS